MPEAFETDSLRFEPEILEVLHGFLQSQPQLSQLVGGLHTFDVVIDANKLFRDLLSRYQSYSQPSLSECLVQAGVLRIHLPQFGVTEVYSDALDRFAKNQAPVARLREEWEAYKQCLTIDSRFAEPVFNHPVITDPKDVPYYQLMNAVNAIGILTEDKGFNCLGLRKMDGNALAPAKAYAMVMQQMLGVRIGVAGAGMVSITGLEAGAKQLLKIWANTPDVIKLLFAGLAIFSVVDPKMRGHLKHASLKFRDGAMPLISAAASAYEKDQGQQQKANEALSKLEERRQAS